MLKKLSPFCGRETAELCPFDAVAKRCWTYRGKNALQNGVIFSSSSMIAPFLSDSISKSGRFCQLSFSLDADFLNSIVLQEIRDRT